MSAKTVGSEPRCKAEVMLESCQRCCMHEERAILAPVRACWLSWMKQTCPSFMASQNLWSETGAGLRRSSLLNLLFQDTQVSGYALSCAFQSKVLLHFLSSTPFKLPQVVQAETDVPLDLRVKPLEVVLQVVSLEAPAEVKIRHNPLRQQRVP